MCINYYLTLNKRFYVCHQVSEYSELIDHNIVAYTATVRISDFVVFQETQKTGIVKQRISCNS